ncbi:MAG: D-glycero-beta-D-manno-heptose-7-phosphate kinase [Spirochaetota bacterium]|nr:D-glycero-beta-D-manno-heptose-7-phosphate kinase [Spirochaetota bacterium]
MNKLDLSSAYVLTVGDIILDKFYLGKVSRISPEAPVPIVQINEQRYALGGAGNVVNNIAHLGAASYLIGIVGKDSNRDITKKLLKDINIESKLFETENPTTTKIRVIGEHQQVVRLDFESTQEIGYSLQEKIEKEIDNCITNVGALTISDYGKGLCCFDLCQYMIKKAKHADIPLIVDPKGCNWDKYKGATIITPNIKEFGQVVGKEIINENEEIEKYGIDVINKLNLEYLLITRSEKGMSLISENGCYHIPTEAIEVYDVSGAGDTVVGTIATALASGLTMLESVQLSNTAAGIVVQKFGTAPIEIDELLHSLHTHGDSKIITQDVLPRIIKHLSKKNNRIIFTYGEFDFLNLKDLHFLKEIREKGDKLIIGFNYPIKDKIHDALIELISNLEFVDYLVTYNNITLPLFLSSIPEDVTIINRGDQ